MTCFASTGRSRSRSRFRAHASNERLVALAVFLRLGVWHAKPRHAALREARRKAGLRARRGASPPATWVLGLTRLVVPLVPHEFRTGGWTTPIWL